MFTFSQVNFGRDRLAGAGEPIGCQAAGRVDLVDQARDPHQGGQEHLGEARVGESPGLLSLLYG